MPEWLKRLTKTDIRNSLAIIIVVGSFLLLYLLQVKPIPEQNHDLVLTAGGFIFGGAAVEVQHCPLWVLCAVLAAAIGKELKDLLDYGKFDWRDAVYTIVGGMSGFILSFF